MPAYFQATVMKAKGASILNLSRPTGMSDKMQREMLETLGKYNAEHQTERIANSDLAARISSYELAYRMQTTTPEATDFTKETRETQDLYGLYDKRSEYFRVRPCGRNCSSRAGP